MKKIKVGIVNYLNTRPLVYGIEQAALRQDIELIEDYPARLAAGLKEGSIDVGLIPVAAIPSLEEWHIVTDYCIGATGPVASVCLFSEVPIEQIETVLLDYQSRTSVALARVLLKEYWKINPVITDTRSGYQQSIKGTTAGVVIGDRALVQREHSTYIYDLAEAWIDHTGLPFVFAAWVSNQPLSDDFVSAFNKANYEGLQHIDTVVAQNPYPVFNLHDYYTRHISYELDDPKRQGLQLFLEKLAVPQEHKTS